MRFQGKVAFVTGGAPAGIVGLTSSAAIEYAARGIRVNAVAPTVVRTPLVELVGAVRGVGTDPPAEPGVERDHRGR